MNKLKRILFYYFLVLTSCNCVRFTNNGFKYSMVNNKYSSGERLLDESGVYFRNLLKDRVDLEGVKDSDLKYFENVKNQLSSHYSLTLINYVASKFKSVNFLFNTSNFDKITTNKTTSDKTATTNNTVSVDSGKEVMNEQKEPDSHFNTKVDMNDDMVKLCKIYENSIVSTLLLYLQLTEDALKKNSKKMFEDERMRMFVELYNCLYNKIYLIVSLNANNLKIYYINDFLHGPTTKPVTLVLGNYSKNLGSLIPNILKFNNLNSLLSFYNIKLKVSSENENVTLSKNALLDELNLILTNIQKHAKSEADFNYGKSGTNKDLVKVISRQQRKIEKYNKLISKKAGAGRLNYVFTYRIPHTNLTLTTSHIDKTNNVELCCIPDNRSHFLGSGGFVKGLPYGNLGIDFNITF